MLIFRFSFFLSALVLCCHLSLFGQSQIEQLERKIISAQIAEKPEIYNQLSQLYLEKNADKSLENAKNALSTAKESKDISSEATAYINIGLANYKLGQYRKAISAYASSIQIYETHNSKAGQGYSLVQIGLCYDKLNEDESSLKTYAKAINIYKELKDSKGISHAAANMGDVYMKAGKVEKAVEKFKESIKYDKATGDKLPMAHSYNKIGITYSNFGNYEKGLVYFDKARTIAKENNYSRLLADIAKNIAIVKKNLLGKKDSKTEYEKVKETKIEEKFQLMEKESSQFDEQTSEFLSRISTLDEANKLNALLLKVKEDDLKQQKMLKEKKEQELELANKERDIKSAELDKTNAIIKQQETQRNALIGGLILILGFVFLLFNGYRIKRNANKQLIQHNKEITSQNEEILRQKEKIEVQRDQLANKNRQITDSIDYARRIQNAILSPIINVRKTFPDSFILFKPKDMVSGDFYWLKEKDEKVLFAVADCTGHGVPGAFMSIIGNNVLNQCLAIGGSTKPGVLLKQVNNEIITRLQRKHEEESSAVTMKDGMDIALCCLDKKTMELQFSGVHNSLYLIRNGKLLETKGENLFIGFGEVGSGKELKTHNIKLQKGDSIYLFSDGFVDQKGGPNKKKFYYGPFKQLLVDLQSKSMAEQHKHLDQTISEWMSSCTQIDDILIFGIRV